MSGHCNDFVLVMKCCDAEFILSLFIKSTFLVRTPHEVLQNTPTQKQRRLQNIDILRYKSDRRIKNP